MWCLGVSTHTNGSIMRASAATRARRIPEAALEAEPSLRLTVGMVAAYSLRLAPSTCEMSIAGMETLEKLPTMLIRPGWLLTTTTAIAPAACAFVALTANGQVPRFTTATLPLTASALVQVGSHPLFGSATTSDASRNSAIFDAKRDCSLAYNAHVRSVPKRISASGHGSSASPANTKRDARIKGKPKKRAKRVEKDRLHVNACCLTSSGRRNDLRRPAVGMRMRANAHNKRFMAGLRLHH